MAARTCGTERSRDPGGGPGWSLRAGRISAILVAALLALSLLGASPPRLAPLRGPATAPNPEQAALGRLLFFDGRLAGDGSTSCATCHDPAKGFADGLPLSEGYPGSLYFRNTPTVINVALADTVFWDGRLPASDLPTVVRDHISEAHFMQADGRLIIERLRQMPAYEEGFARAFGGEPTYGRILNSIAAYLGTLTSRDVPLDRYLRGNPAALAAPARRGLALFSGKAGCIACHNGPTLSDGEFRSVGLSETPDIFETPERHVTFRRFFRTFGVSEYANLRTDVGRYAVTKQDADRGLFRTPSLREVSKTAPYMHDGSLATLAEVVAFYDRGGGDSATKDSRLAPLGLSEGERADLVAFLESLAGSAVDRAPEELPAWGPRELCKN